LNEPKPRTPFRRFPCFPFSFSTSPQSSRSTPSLSSTTPPRCIPTLQVYLRCGTGQAADYGGNLSSVWGTFIKEVSLSTIFVPPLTKYHLPLDRAKEQVGREAESLRNKRLGRMFLLHCGIQARTSKNRPKPSTHTHSRQSQTLLSVSGLSGQH